MPVKIRLQRHGKKGKPFYWVVAADSRSKRDGKFLEKLGTYNPNTNPATINLDVDGSVKWLQNGAQPTDTAWMAGKEEGIQAKIDGLDKAKADAKAKALEAEKEVSDKRAAALAPAVEEEVAEEAAEATEAVAETTEVAEATTEAPAEEAPATEAAATEEE